MENRGLLFIPDISGFSKFVNEIEINHSKTIIQELLEILIRENRLGLEISEIEGDAILFYKFGEAPDLKEIYTQVEQMFTAFHRHLGAYEIRKYCHCKACIGAIKLTLKIITHYGEFTGYQVQQFNKLIGKDVIVAHQLLKNDIDQHEYWLVTRSLLPDVAPADYADWMKWETSTKRIESGEIKFHYTQLGPLKYALPPQSVLDLSIPDKVKMISLSREYDNHIITLFHATGDFNFRSKWMEGVKSVEEVDHFLPRVGMKCKCTLEDGHVVMFSSSYSFHPARIEFGETDEHKRTSYLYTLEKINDNKTRVTLDYYLRRNLIDLWRFRLGKKKEMEASLSRSMEKLDVLVRGLGVPRLEF